jgi:alcohol dehydrogenase class IV
MNTARFRVLPSIYFGPGTSAQTADHLRSLGSERILLVTDSGIRSAGIIELIERALRGSGFDYRVFDGVSRNPRDFECLEAAKVAREFEADSVLAVGGGSPIDLAKVAAGLATNEGAPREWAAPRPFGNPPLPIVAIPTTAGTGSEVTRSAVINDTERMIKITIRKRRIAPRIAIVDPDLTLGLPPNLTAATGMDALTHAVEAYTCNKASPITDALALHAMRLIAANLRTAVSDGANRAAREGMMMASVIAGMAFSNADVAAVHCIAEAIGGRYDTPHGVANSVFLPHVFARNAIAAPERHAEVATALGAADRSMNAETACERGAAYLNELGRDIGIPRFSELPGIRAEDFPWIAAASAENLSNSSNARPMAENDYLELLEDAWAEPMN